MPLQNGIRRQHDGVVTEPAERPTAWTHIGIGRTTCPMDGCAQRNCWFPSEAYVGGGTRQATLASKVVPATIISLDMTVGAEDSGRAP